MEAPRGQQRPPPKASRSLFKFSGFVMIFLFRVQGSGFRVYEHLGNFGVPAVYAKTVEKVSILEPRETLRGLGAGSVRELE